MLTTYALTLIEIHSNVTIFGLLCMEEEDSTVTAPFCCPLQYLLLLGVWLHEVDLEVQFSPQFASEAHCIQWQGTHGVTWQKGGRMLKEMEYIVHSLVIII